MCVCVSSVSSRSSADCPSSTTLCITAKAILHEILVPLEQSELGRVSEIEQFIWKESTFPFTCVFIFMLELRVWRQSTPHSQT